MTFVSSKSSKRHINRNKRIKHIIQVLIAFNAIGTFFIVNFPLFKAKYASSTPPSTPSFNRTRMKSARFKTEGVLGYRHPLSSYTFFFTQLLSFHFSTLSPYVIDEKCVCLIVLNYRIKKLLLLTIIRKKRRIDNHYEERKNFSCG